MASKLTERDKNILDANNFEVVGNKPYEDGKWGTQGPKDFVHLQIFDANNNLIQYESFGVDRFITNVDSDKIEFFPGNHIRSLGFESGTFTVRYNFLRKLAGDESAVLVHTLDKNDTKIGDVYTNTDNIYITEDGVIYAANERDYKDNQSTTEQLKIEDLKYQIHEISPSRTEVRLRAKNIRSSYINDFVDIQTPYNLVEVTELPNPNGDIEIKITGLRPGEKLYEELLIDAEAEKTDHPLIFRAKENFMIMDEIIPKLKNLKKNIDARNKDQTLKILNELVKEWVNQNKIKQIR